MIVLRAFPVALFEASSAQWSDMLRDYLLRGIGGASQPYGVDDVGRSVRALDQLRAAVAGAVERADDPGAAEGSLDVPVHLDGITAGEFALLQGVLDHARRLAFDGLTLTLPALPETVVLRDWLCDQVMAQEAGGEPTPWRFVDAAAEEPEVDLAEWDDAIAPADHVPWLVGDDHNRIIGASPAALSLLGWEPGELVGQRLLAVIPDRLRERHVAAFTRGVVSGEHRLLGQPLELPALTKDGREIPITLTLSRHPGRRGRTVFLARLEPSADQ